MYARLENFWERVAAYYNMYIVIFLCDSFTFTFHLHYNIIYPHQQANMIVLMSRIIMTITSAKIATRISTRP